MNKSSSYGENPITAYLSSDLSERFRHTVLVMSSCFQFHVRTHRSGQSDTFPGKFRAIDIKLTELC